MLPQCCPAPRGLWSSIAAGTPAEDMLPSSATGAGVVLQDGQHLVPQDFSSSRDQQCQEVGRSPPEHHLGVIKEGVEEAEEP